MLQQTTSDRSHDRLAFIKGFSAGSSDKKELKKILEYLGDDYSAVLRIASNLSSHGKWIPYSFLANRLKKIGDEMRAQAELIRAMIVQLGGTVPQIAINSREDVDFRQNVRRLVGDMEEHAGRSEMLVHQKNNIREGGVIKLIEAIASEMQKQKEELLDIVMRLS